MRVAIVAESFLPRINGVSNSVVRVARFLRAHNHDVLIIAPDAYTAEAFEDIPVSRVLSVGLPGVQAADLAVTSADRLARELRDFRADVLHLASPFVLGHSAVRAANLLGIPTVAIFQTDIAGFAVHYGLSAASALADGVIRRIHRRVDLTLVPSTDSQRYLQELGIHNIARWGRGVDVEMFHPKWADEHLFGPRKRLTIGYLGRLAPEKNVEILTALAQDPLYQVVIIGDGPARAALQEAMPHAHFTGMLGGQDLSRHVASLDVLVAPGERETFCQVIQEGMAAGLPVLAPAVGGPRDLITPDLNGWLYEPGNQRDLQRHVDYLAWHPEQRRAIGAAARATVEGRTWDSVCNELVGHYRQVIDAQVLAS